MFKAILSNESLLLFKSVIDSLKDLVTDSNIDISFDENEDPFIEITSMDACHVSLIKVQFNMSFFKHITVSKKTILGINIINLSKILKCAENEDELEMYSLDSSDSLDLTFINKERTSEFSVNLIDIETEPLEIPDIGYDANITIKSKQISKLINNIYLLSPDLCNISINNQILILSSYGDIGKSKNTIVNNENTKINNSKEVNLSFSSKYLLLFTKANISDIVNIKLSEDYPLLYNYTFTGGYLNYYLAARLSE